MKAIEKIKGFFGHWDLKKEQKALDENLKTLPVDDKLYAPTLEAREKIGRIRNDKTKTIAEVGGKIADIGVKAIGVAGMLYLGMKAYEIDKSDEIVQNKNTKDFWKGFKLF